MRLASQILIVIIFVKVSLYANDWKLVEKFDNSHNVIKSNVVSINFFDSNYIAYRIPLFIGCTCCSDESLNFTVSSPDSNCCYQFNLSESYGTSGCDSVRWVKYSQVGQEYSPQTRSVGNPSDTTNGLGYLKICNDSEELQQYYFEFFTDETLDGDSKRKCYKVIELEPCSDTCRAADIDFDVIGPNSSCCYEFIFEQNMSSSTCDSVTNILIRNYSDALIYREGGKSILNFPICNGTDTTLKFYFEFYSENSYNTENLVCKKLISLDPCIDTAAVCCEQIRLNLDLEKGGCGESKCSVTQRWEMPDSRYDCFTLYVNVLDTLDFDSSNPLIILPKDCLDPDESLNGSVTLLRFPGDPNPCIVNYQAYCPIEDIRQSCDPDSCHEIWYDGILDRRKIDSGYCKDCELTIHYTYRKSCDDWQDLQITGIDAYSPNDDSIHCNCSTDSIFKKALEMVIKENDMQFDPKWPLSGNPCNIQWRVSLKTCWTNWVAYETPPNKIGKGKIPTTQDISPMKRVSWTVYRPCDSSCCARRFRVCKYCDHDSCVTIDDLGALTGGGSCDTVKYENTLDCYSACDFFNDIHYSILPEFTEDDVLNIKENINNGRIIVSNDNIKMKIFLEKYDSEKLDISFYNITGQTVILNNGTIKRNKNVIEIDISSLISGVYVFRISDNGVLLDYGKILIIR